MKRSLFRPLAAASAVVLGASVVGAAGFAAAATDGVEATYLVLAPGTATSQAKARVAAAGGTVAADYHQIGVVVARSTNPDFVSDVAGRGVEAAASTDGLGTLLDEGETLETVGSAEVAASHAAGEPLYGLQWDMPQINVAEAHEVATGEGVVVGVLDSGISSSHPDLASQIAKDKSVSCLEGVQDTSEAAWNPTTSDHGTHVAGTIAAAINGVGVTGVAPGAKVAAVKVVNDDGYIYPEAALCGFMWAAEQGMDVTNNSYYIDPWQWNCRNDARQQPVWQAVQRAIRYSQSKGVLNIASAGNSNVDLQHKFIDDGSPNDGSYPVEERTINGACVVLPGQAPGVVTVSATGPTEEKSYYSSYGLGDVDVAAPGGDARFRSGGSASNAADAILSTTFNTVTRTNGWGYKQGTSMASPHAAGVAALALSANPRLSPGALAAVLERTAQPLACPDGVYNPTPALGDRYEATCYGGQRNGFYGAGEVDALAAVQ
ncbi:S8 family peptidase [Intrasporangium sp.]|uniref:S8 family peptidase n=1 Tax=Intrasporangium sp. TaxID=1925024 RepID=UPI00293A05F9|nr:S8 family serine peptidase [Intrasporangium sp.]MDV3220740.1 S8 family serine peptidase [Intrasporangium sp.]